MKLDTVKILIIVFFIFFIIALFATIVVHTKKDTSKLERILSIISLCISIIVETSAIVVNFNSIRASIYDETTTTTSSTTTTTTTTTTSTTSNESEKNQNSNWEEIGTVEGDEATTQIRHKFNVGSETTYTKIFEAKTTGRYGFNIDINSIENKYRITIYNSKKEEILSKEYVPNDSDNNEFYHQLYGGEKYYIQVDCIKGTPEAKITIYYPPKPKQ